MSAQDPNNPQDPNAQSPIEPGQFVTSGDGGGVFKQPGVPQAQNVPASDPNAPQAPAQPGSQFAQSIPPQGIPNPQAPAPDPTPYIPPQASNQQPQSPQSTISNLKKVLIIVGFLVLILLIGALAWIFVLGGKLPGQAKTTPEPSPIIQATPSPARTTGGFSELPAATEEAAQEATPTPIVETPTVQ